MKPLFEEVEVGLSQSIKTRSYRLKRLEVPYHYHPEVELVWIKKSVGQVFVRNSMAGFKEENLIMFGGGVPHFLINDQAYYDNELDVELFVIQFHRLFEEHLSLLPEFQQIRSLIRQANSGILWSGVNLQSESFLSSMQEGAGMDNLILVLRLLNELATKEKILIDPHAERIEALEIPKRLQEVKNFLLSNYHKEITLEEVANKAAMSKPAFCRYFKEHTRMTFSNYLNNLRIEYASKLLIKSSFPVSQICYDVGYSNMPYFIRQFKKNKGTTPKQYRLKNQYKY